MTHTMPHYPASPAVDPRDLEAQGWQTLALSGEEAREFYGRVLDDEPVFLLPGDLVLDDRQAVVDAMSGQPWESYELLDVRELRPEDDVAIVVYRVTARRSGDAEYGALCSSTYARRGEHWRLVLHQQTPVTPV